MNQRTAHTTVEEEMHLKNNKCERNPQCNQIKNKRQPIKNDIMNNDKAYMSLRAGIQSFHPQTQEG